MVELRRLTEGSGLPPAIWAARVFLLLAGAASAVALARSSFPFFVDFASSALPPVWDSFRSWLVPPYLFATVHLIIIVIWKLSDKNQPLEAKPRDPLSRKPSGEAWTPDPVPAPATDDQEKFSDAVEESEETPPVPPPLLFGNLDRVPGAAVVKENDTMDATWRAIVESTSRPQLKKSDTWERSEKTLERAAAAAAAAGAVGGPKKPEFRKSATFREPSAAEDGGGWRSREVLSTGHEELDQRFEAFIRMNYERMRLQRQESHQRYMEMMNGTY